MRNKVINAIKRHQMLCAGDTVLAGLSGGADSMALVHVLLSLRDELNIRICAAHFNHGIRGAEADRDEQFCARACEKFGIELYIGRANIPALAAERNLGIEECGRIERYAFFERVMPNAKIATAHTLSDCEETFLFNLSRGATLKGLCSVPPVRKNIIRPLIDCSRTEIESYCRGNGIEYVTDSTNLSDEYTRNRLRHKAVPELKAVNPAFDSAFSRCLNSLREDEELLCELADSVLERAETPDGYIVNVLSGVHPSLRKRAVAAILAKLCGEAPEAVHVDAVCKIIESGGSTQVLGGCRLYVRGGVLKKIPEHILPWEEKFCMGAQNLPYYSVETAIYDKNDKINIQKINKQLLANLIDYDKIKEPLFWSSMREGDKIRLSGRGVTKQLRRIFSEMGIEPALRLGVPVLRDCNGIVWVAGVGSDERFRPTENSKHLLLPEVLNHD